MTYYLKVWLSTILVSPILLLLVLAIANATEFSELYTAIPLYGLMIGVGFVLSIPTMFLFYFLNFYLTKNSFELRRRKFILSGFSIIGVYLTFYLYDKGFIFSSIQSFLWPTIYSFTIVLSVCVLKGKNIS
jgi:hypothetical protein